MVWLWGQNPCEDERFLRLNNQVVNRLSSDDYEYYKEFRAKCSEYKKQNTNFNYGLSKNNKKFNKIRISEVSQ